MLIYVAGPYTAADDEGHVANVNRAIDVALDLLERGHTPYVPHLTHYVDLRTVGRYGARLPWALYMRWDDAFLLRCDGLLRYARSRGADIEYDRAVSLGLAVWDRIEDVPVIGNLVDEALAEEAAQGKKDEGTATRPARLVQAHGLGQRRG